MDYRREYEKWLSDPTIDDVTKKELKGIANRPEEIEDRFYKELEFGTGGLRGVLGAGTNRLNIYTVRKATQGLANYILSSDVYEPHMGVAIAHDSRRMSPEFSTEAALVLNANGIKTYTFDSLRPTPLLSFAVRHLGCVAGIVVTASHNPPEYNGYKVYWSDGGQCPYPRDEAIIDEVQKVKDFSMVKTMDFPEAKSKGLFNIADASVDDAFIANVKAQCLNPEIIPKSGIKVVFTPLHGAGSVTVQRALKEVGFRDVHVVKEQELPDGNFPTLEYPNPEDIDVYKLAIDLAEKEDADIVVATDPDCDRVGVVIKDYDDYIQLDGNMTGVILADYMLQQMKDKGKLTENGVLISTIVSTRMTREIAEANGIEYMEVLTGFKYIGEKIKEFEETGSHNFIFGFEESYGYLTGTYARDKDAVAATVLICEAAAYYRSKGLTFGDALAILYEKHGIHRESVESITLKGVEGVENIKKIMADLRDNPPSVLDGSAVVEVRDYKNGTIVTVDGTTPTHLPVSDVLYYVTADESWVCVRPSGTEPKIKIYFGIKMDKETFPRRVDEKLARVTKCMMEVLDVDN